MRDKVTEGCRKLCNKTLDDVQCSIDIIGVVRSHTGHVERIGYCASLPDFNRVTEGVRPLISCALLGICV
jgi:hypothetical protein